ncbi:MAG: D-alanine--D-alanine ligase family protein [Balneolales bacterium]
MMSQNNVLVAFGGVSPEHEVSVLTALQAIAALNDKYNPIPLYITKHGKWLTGESLLELENYQDILNLEAHAESCTLAFAENGKAVLLETKTGFFSKPRATPLYAVLNAFHGADGENGSFQGVCEMFNLPSTGAGVTGSAVGMDKRMAKDLCSAHDIPVTKHVWFNEQKWIDSEDAIKEEITRLGFPVFIKPVHLGSSIGVTRAVSVETAGEAIETAFRYDPELIVEEAIHPLLEVNCSVLGDENNARASVCEQPIGREEILSFDDKYMSGDSGGKGMASAERKIPAPIPDELTHHIQELSVKIFKLLKVSGVARLDFLINADTQKVFFNEINTIPGSFSFYLWDKSGTDFPDLLDELITIAVRQNQLKNSRVRSYETNLLSTKSVKGIKGLKK